MQADRLLEAGDLDGAAVCLRIVAAIRELQQRQPDGRVQRGTALLTPPFAA